MPVIVMTNYYKEEPYRLVQSVVPDGFTLHMPEDAKRESLLRLLEKVDAEYILAGGRTKINEEILSYTPHLKMIQRTGVGMDCMDAQALTARGIPVYVNAGVNAVSVAEHTVLLLLSVLRRMTEIDAQMHEGIWKKQENGIRNHELFGKTVGFVGMGHIGEKTVQMLSGFGVRFLYDAPHQKPELEKFYGLTRVSYEELLKNSDIVIFLCALNDQTRGMLGAEQIAKMKTGSVVINTARGALIEEKALLEALKSGKLSGAGLDVFEKEPPDADNAFFQMKNVVLSPHIGGVTQESFQRMMRTAMHNMVLYEQGRTNELEDRLWKTV